MAKPAYAALAYHLVATGRRDLLEPLAYAYATFLRLALLIARAEQDHDLANARRLKIESMRSRADAEHAVYLILEAVGDDEEGNDLVDELLGNDGRTLAQVLLDD